MTYAESINEILRPSDKHGDIVVADLFAGCGGLALGFESMGFTTVGYEMLSDPCETYNRNLNGRCHQKLLTEGSSLNIEPNIIIGGPPCQPFSVIGKQGGKRDERNGFPAFLALVKRHNPDLVIFENVRGMLYRNKDYLKAIVEDFQCRGYIVEVKLLNALRYGVPQRRERLFVVGHRGEWRYPTPTTGTSVTAGDALGELASSMPPSPKFLTESMDSYIAKYEAKSKCIRPRDLHLDRPSRTLTCRNLHGATSDMMRIRLEDGKRRRLTVREGARLQSFPDWFGFVGPEGSQFNQVGNAVPPLLARAVAKSALEYLKSDVRYSNTEISEKNDELTGKSLDGWGVIVDG